MMKAINLRTEYLAEPLGLGNAKPRFCWNCVGGAAQTAYRIVCRRDGSVVWDSGEVETSSMTHVTYGGEALRSRDRVEWSITLRDEHGEWGESSESRFELGLLSPSDRYAKWITGNYKAKKNVRYPVDCFRTVFRANKPVASARLYASARGIYDVTVNGRRIEDFILAPGMTDYRKRIQYQTYDVTEYLTEENTLELRLADGWYRGSSAAYGVTNVYGVETAIIAQLEITYTDNSRDTVCTDETWSWSNDGPIRFADLKDGEVYDASLTPSYSGKAKIAKVDANLVASDNVSVREKERFAARLLPNNILDFGQNIAGYVEFKVKGRRGQKLKLTCGEILDSNGELDMSNIQLPRPAKGWSQLSIMKMLLTNKVSGASIPTPLQEIVFTCSGGEDVYKTSFAVFGFRYAKIETDINFDPADFTAIAVYSDMEQIGDFTCSNELVNRFLENTRWSMKGNFLDLPTDCPTRERLGWTGDAQIFFDTGAYLMDTAAFFRKWLRDMEDAQYKNGLLPAVLPYQGVEMMYRNSGASVGWTDAVYLIPYRWYKRFGDKSVLEQSYPMIEKYAEYLFAHTGLRDKKAARLNPYDKYTYEKGFHLGEWLEPAEFQEQISAGNMPKHPEECTAYFHLAMTTIGEIARLLGRDDMADRCTEYADGSKKAYEHLFVKTGMLDTDRQAKLVRPLAFGLLDGGDREYAKKRLVQAVENYGNRVGTGFLSTPFILPVLTAAGEVETAYKMLENTNKPSWLGEVVDGATTVWENWDGEASRNHYSPGAVCEWLFGTVAGINVAGENSFRIEPIPGGTLTYARASWRSIYGTVESAWERTADGVKFSFTIPANTTAEVVLPNGEHRTLGAGKYEMECAI